MDVHEVLRMQRGGEQEDVVERNAAQDRERGGVERGERDAFAGALGMAGLVAERVHGLDGFGLPVRDDAAGVLVEAEVPADVEVEVEPVAFVAEQGVALGDGVGRDERAKRAISRSCVSPQVSRSRLNA